MPRARHRARKAWGQKAWKEKKDDDQCQATRAQEVAALIDETLSYSVKATGKHEASMRQQLANKKLENLRRSRGIGEHALKRNSASTTRKTKRGNKAGELQAEDERGFRERVQSKCDARSPPEKKG